MRFVKPTWLNSLGVKVLLAYVAGMVLSVALLPVSYTHLTLPTKRIV